MWITIAAVGRLKTSPEANLISEYLLRFERSGRQLGLGPAHMREVEDRKGGGMSAEAVLLRKMIPEKSIICCLDERGHVETSPQFSDRLAKWRDDGCSELAFVIGGADGIDPALRRQSDHLLSFGKMVWPHMLARVMLAEQLYRASSILAGSPYHRV